MVASFLKLEINLTNKKVNKNIIKKRSICLKYFFIGQLIKKDYKINKTSDFLI